MGSGHRVPELFSLKLQLLILGSRLVRSNQLLDECIGDLASIHQKQRMSRTRVSLGELGYCSYNLVMRVMMIGVLVLAVQLQSVRAQDSTLEFKSLYDSHRWFELRDEIAKSHSLGFYKAAVAAAFN